MKDVLLKEERIERKFLGNFSGMLQFIIRSSLKPFTFTGNAQTQYILRKIYKGNLVRFLFFHEEYLN